MKAQRASSDQQPATGGGLRRERRNATEVEIKATGRRLLVQGGDAMSLRAIARAMGLTAPALYRYYANYEDLVSALAVDVYDELVAALEHARDGVSADDTATRLFAVSRAFRVWSLGHAPEFRLLFANPITRPANTERPGTLAAAGQRFGRVFSDLVAELWRRGRFPAANEAGRHPQVAGQLAVHPLAVGGLLPPDALYVFLRCWARLYGMVTMEVFGLLRWAVEDTEPLFEDMLVDNARALGIVDQYHRDLNRRR